MNAVLECLPDGNEVLGRAYSLNGIIQGVADVHANWTHRRRIPYAETHVIRVQVGKSVKADSRKHVPAVIKADHPKALFKRYGDSRFRVDDQHLAAAGRHTDKSSAVGGAV